MNNFVRKYIRFAIKHYKLVVAVSAALLVLCIVFASNVVVDNNLEGLLPQENPVLASMERMEAEFDGQDEIIIAIVSNNTESAKNFMSVLGARVQLENPAANVLYRLEIGAQITYFVSESGNMYLMIVAPNIGFANFEADRNLFFSKMQTAIDETLAMPDFTNLEAGMAGGILIWDYESDKVMMDGFFVTAIVTLAITLVLFALSFKRLVLPLVTALPLVLGVALSAAFATLVFDYLNFFAMFSMVLLLGLGLDYAIHILARYGEERSKGNSLEDALVITLRQTGAAMIVGTTTSMATFLSFLFAQTRAFEQVGIVSAVGILLAMLSQFAVTPALIAWIDHKKEAAANTSYAFMRPVGRYCARRGGIITIVTIIVMGALFASVRNIPISGDLTMMFPEDLPSLGWQERVQAEFDFNPDEITIMAENLYEMMDFIYRLEASPHIATVESIAQFLPEHSALWEPTLAMLPVAITERFVGNTGRFLLRVTAHGDVWDSGAMTHIRDELAILTPYVGGMPVLMNEIMSIVMRDAILCSIIAGIAIFAMLLVMFRSFKYAIITFLPVGIAVYLLLGILSLAGAELTIASGLSIPLVIGLGISGAVHITYRIRVTKDIPESLVHTGKAVVISEVTTLVAFASLMVFTSHPALVGLGMEVSLGLGLCLMLNMILLPAVLGFVRKRKAI